MEQPSDEQPSTAVGQDDAPVEAEGKVPLATARAVPTIIALMLTTMCIAMDSTIVSTAIPVITDEFHSVSEIGWYASAYLLTTCAFQLVYGKLYSVILTTHVFYGCLLLFEVGSVVSAAASSSVVLIIGRAICGLGGAGLYTGAIIIVNQVVVYHRRPIAIAALGLTFSVFSIIGPILGGALTAKATWRWCFWINLPLGGATFLILLLFLRVPHHPNVQKTSFVKILGSIDLPGTVLFVSAVTCLLLALEWGGFKYAWSNGRIIALLTVFAASTVSFIIVQIFTSDSRATVPWRIIKRRNVVFSSIFNLCFGGSFFSLIYYLPTWFQAVQGVSPIVSGVRTLPLLLPEFLGLALSGTAVSVFGPYVPWMWSSTVFMSIGAGLVYTFTAAVPTGRWAGYLVVYGFGAGCGWQQPQTAMQAVLPPEDIPIATAIGMFTLLLGGSVFASVGQNLFSAQLVESVAKLNIPGLDVKDVFNAGATNLTSFVPPRYLQDVRVAYNSAIVDVFRLSLILACLTVLGTIGMEWISVKKAEAPESKEVKTKSQNSGQVNDGSPDNEEVKGETPSNKETKIA